MSLPYSNISSFFYPYTEAYTEKSISDRFAKLLENDKYIANHFLLAPGIWHCSWYNDSLIPGYSMGDICWLNTTNITSFINDNYLNIKKYSDNNPVIHKNLKDYIEGNDEIFEQYYNVLTGYTDDSGVLLSALYEVGQLSKPIQLFVSLKDNNKNSLNDRNAWRPFFVDDYDTVEPFLQDLIRNKICSVFKEHNNNYHLHNEDLTAIDLNTLVNLDCSNFYLGYQHYNLNKEHWSGFDFVKYFIKHPYKDANSTKIVQNQWFRLWNSGYLEHGGVLNINNMISADNVLSVNLKWKLTDDIIMAYNDGVLSKNGNIISVDESEYAGDNFINLITEITDLKVEDSEYAICYDTPNYQISLSPILVNTDNDIYNKAIYKKPIDNAVLNHIYINKINTDSFSLHINNHHSTLYYSYNTAGYITLR